MFKKAISKACLTVTILSVLISLPLYALDNIAWTPMNKTFYMKPLSERGVRNKNGTFKGKEPTQSSWTQYRDGYNGNGYTYDSSTDTW